MQSRAAAPRFFLLLFFLLLIWVSLLPWHSLPAIVPASAPASQFSAERAMADLAFIAAEPRPSGSPAPWRSVMFWWTRSATWA